MILSCPRCATGYFVDDGQIKPGGRTVKCAACGLKWTAQPPTDTAQEGPRGERPGASGVDVPKTFRAKAGQRRRGREAALTGAALGGAAVIVALAAGAMAAFRGDIVEAMPGAAAAYQMIGLPVNRVGLVIEGLHAEPTLQDGHAALAVFGVIRNIETRPIASPPLRIGLYDRAGARVGGRIATAPGLSIPAGAKRRFAVAIIDPPFSAQNLEVGFAAGRSHGGILAKPLTPANPTSLVPFRLKGPIG